MIESEITLIRLWDYKQDTPNAESCNVDRDSTSTSVWRLVKSKKSQRSRKKIKVKEIPPPGIKLAAL